MPLYSVNGHKEIINCIDGVGGLGVGEGAPEIATGSRDGTQHILKHVQFTNVFFMRPTTQLHLALLGYAKFSEIF